MPVSKIRKKSKNKKGPTPPNKLKKMRELIDFLEKAERDYFEQQTNNEETKNG